MPVLAGDLLAAEAGRRRGLPLCVCSPLVQALRRLGFDPRLTVRAVILSGRAWIPSRATRQAENAWAAQRSSGPYEAELFTRWPASWPGGACGVWIEVRRDPVGEGRRSVHTWNERYANRDA